MIKLFYLLIVALIFFNTALAVNIKEIQELRLTKAELSVVDGDYKKAIRYLNKNIFSKYFHLESYLFLAEIYLKKGKNSKALRVYYHVVKRQHAKELLESASSQDLQNMLHTIPHPRKDIVPLYFTIGNLYYNLYNEGVFSAKYRKKLLDLATKYFIICNYYKYNTPTIAYYRALIAREKQNYNEAIDFFITSKEQFQEMNVDNAPISSIDYLLADTLIREGHFDAGVLFLKSIYHSPTANASLKEYSNTYLDSLASSYVSTTFSYGMAYKDNINGLTDKILGNDWDLYKYYYTKKHGFTDSVGLNMFYASKRHKYWAYTFTLSANQETAQNDKLGITDSRSFTGSVEAKYDNLIKSLVKINYTYGLAFTKYDYTHSFHTYSNTHYITPQYIHTLKRGTISYKFPLTFSNNDTYDSNTNYGLGVSYTPYWHTKYIAPTVSVEYTDVEEGDNYGDDYNRSSRYTISLSNHSSFYDNLSLFLYASYIKNENSYNVDGASLGYSYLSLNAYLTYLFKFVKNLSINFNFNKTTTNKKNGDKINQWTTSSNLSYTF